MFRPILAAVVAAFTAFQTFSLSAPPAITGTLKLGAGGLVSGIDIASDGTKVIRTDVGGAWYCPAPCSSVGPANWIQVISASSMPSGDSNAAIYQFTGAYEIKLSPSSPTTFYIYFVDSIYKGTYSGGAVTVTKTNFPATAASSNDDPTKNFAHHIAVDPQNSNVVVAGGPSSNIKYTLDGGATWTSISGLCTPSTPSGAAQGGGYTPAFDPTSGTTTNSGVTVTAGVYIGCYGTGTYHSTAGPAGAFSQTTGGPTTFHGLIVASDGSVCVADNNGSTDATWGFFSGAWTHIAMPSQGSRAIMPAQGPSHFYYLTDDGVDFFISTVSTHCGSGGTWTGLAFTNCFNQTAPDIPWLASDYNFCAGLNMSGTGGAFDSANGRLYSSMGTGVIYVATPSSNSGITWLDQSAPIEELVANRVTTCAGGFGPLAVVWDRGVFNASNSIAAYPSKHGTVTPSSSSSPQIVAGWDLDCSASNNGFVVCLCNWFGVDQSGYSTNGGVVWNVFSALPAENGSLGNINGSIATGDNQTILWAVQGAATHLFYTTDQGAHWTQVGSGLCANIVAGGWSNSQFLNRHVIASDKSLTNTFYFYNNAVPSFYKMTFSGGTPTCVQTRTSALDTLGSDGVNDNFNVQMKAVPGQASNLFYTSGAQGPLNTSQPFWRSVNGGAIWTQVSGVFSVQDFDFGAAKPSGGGYPAIFIYGMANGATKMGIYRSDDNALTWTGPLEPCAKTFSGLGSCPNNNIDLIKSVGADLATYGRYYIGYSGTGYSYGN